MGTPIAIKSNKQRTVAESSTEAELIALNESVDLILWCKEILEFLGYNQQCIPIFQDNTSTITQAYMGTPSKNARRRYVDVKYFKIKEYLDMGILKLEYLPTDDHPADLQASIRGGQQLKRARIRMGLNE
jgi:hypothetical protein